MLVPYRKVGQAMCLIQGSENIVTIRVAKIQQGEVWLEIEQTDQQAAMKIELQGSSYFRPGTSFVQQDKRVPRPATPKAP